MTTEEDFQHALDANPNDWQTRLVFADWLQDRDDPRAEGYRAMGFLRARPVDIWFDDDGAPFWGIVAPKVGWGPQVPEVGAIPWARDVACEFEQQCPQDYRTWRCHYSRRAAEDAIALAFAALPAERRDDLLSGAFAESA